ncbi:proteoglycan 4-like [Patiria miniata]|uniref:Shisa N-terminal domain-containing protein n=1 Tax=Patiria miniata TaxID=46514 RepID=A0A914BD72_PATMI|nr:proteoglycan 4-like [Patiria miniata]
MAPCIANANSALHLMLITTLISIIDFAIADYCQGYTDYTGESISGFYCPGFSDDYRNYKCCGPSDSQYCCDFEAYNNYHGSFYWSVGKIIGVVIGGIIGLVLLVVVIVIIVGCHVRKLKRQRQPQQTATNSSAHQMTRTTTAQRQNYPHHSRSNPQQSRSNTQPKPASLTKEQAYESLSYPPPAYTTLPRSYRREPEPTYPREPEPTYPREPEPTYPSSQGYHQQGQQQPTLSYTDYSQRGLEEYSSPQPDYYTHKPEAANTYAPELAPPPPNNI